MDCVHTFERVGLRDWVKKCYCCTRRTRFPWKRMLKCKTCRIVCHVKCAVNAPQTSNLESPAPVVHCTEPVVTDDNQNEGSTIATGPIHTPAITEANGSESEVPVTVEHSPESEAPVFEDDRQQSNVSATETVAPAIDADGQNLVPPTPSVAANSPKLDFPAIASQGQLENVPANVTHSLEPITRVLGPGPGSLETSFPCSPQPSADDSPNAEAGCLGDGPSPTEAIDSGDEPLEPGSLETTFPCSPQPSADDSPNAEARCLGDSPSPTEAIGSGDEPLELPEVIFGDKPTDPQNGFTA